MKSIIFLLALKVCGDKVNGERCKYYREVGILQNAKSYEHDICEMEDGRTVIMKGLRDFLSRSSKINLISGKTNLLIPDATIHINSLKFPIEAKVEVQNIDTSHNKLEPIQGIKKVLVLREASNMIDAETLSDKIFSTSGDLVSLKSQFNACSYGKLMFEPFIGMTSSGTFISNGIGEVSINLNETETNNLEVVDAMRIAAIEKYGDLESQFDYVMISVPQQTNLQGALAYAYTGSYLSVYKEFHIVKSIIQIHEIGHNLGLAHSNEAYESYQDKTGHMGLAKLNDDYRACFNGAKSWQLGWYSGSYYSLDPTVSTFSDRIVGIVDYEKRGDMNTIIELNGSQKGAKYYVAFNRKASFNSETSEGGDQVLITCYIGKGASASNLEAKLSEGDEKIFHEYSETRDVYIKVDRIFISSDSHNPSFAEITITSNVITNSPSNYPTITRIPTYSPTYTPTISQTSSPTRIPTVSITTAQTVSITRSPTSSPVKKKRGCKKKKKGRSKNIDRRHG